jgi:hypothetical protein
LTELLFLLLFCLCDRCKPIPAVEKQALLRFPCTSKLLVFELMAQNSCIRLMRCDLTVATPQAICLANTRELALQTANVVEFLGKCNFCFVFTTFLPLPYNHLHTHTSIYSRIYNWSNFRLPESLFEGGIFLLFVYTHVKIFPVML